MKHIEIEKQSYERFKRTQQKYLRESPMSADGNFVKRYRIRLEARKVAEEVVLKELIYD